jgi:dolichol-phosphate mannosyltransferase
MKREKRMASALRPTISIVCPAYEEEEVLPKFHAELATILAEIEHEYEVEIIYVDDGSRDRTLQILRELAAADHRVQYLSFSRNFGHQAAITAGLERASGDAVITLDSDLQHPPALIPSLLAKWREGFEIVQTLRRDDRRVGPLKRLTSRGFYRVMHWLSETEVRPAAADFRLLSRKALDSLLKLRETHRFLRGMVGWLGFPTATIWFAPAQRGAGVTKFTFLRMSRFALDALLSFSKVPLRLSMVLGLVVFLMGVGYGGYSLARALFTSGPADLGLAPVLTALYLIGGCILCGLGVVGEYVGRVYEQVKARPLYVVKEASPHRETLPTGLDTPSRKPYRVGSTGGPSAA